MTKRHIPKWIAVIDRLPKDCHEWNCYVMNCRRGAYGFFAFYDYTRNIFQLDNREHNQSPALDVTHWYPLPYPIYENPHG